MSKIITDRTGKVIGRIDGNYIYDNTGRVKGRYDESSDKTYTNTGMVFGSGDLRVMLLAD